MDRRVPSSTREVAGATLTISTMGGYSVLDGDDYIGFLHAAQGSLFNAYLRVPDAPADWLGKYTAEDGVRAIMRACGRTMEEVA